MEILDKIQENRIVPVIVLKNAADAKPLGEALLAGGLPIAEITFRTDEAEEALRLMSSECPGILAGAGSITSVTQAKKAMDAGAKFLVTAGFNRRVTEFAIEMDLPIFPGVCTPSEIMFLIEYNLPVAKFFPAEQYGGLNTVKALSAPFPNLKFMPTGGINSSNVKEYLSFDKVVACGGSWMVNESHISEGNFDEITRLVSEAVELVKRV